MKPLKTIFLFLLYPSISFTQIPTDSLTFLRDTNLMQIMLVRHGEPALMKSGNFNRKEASEFMKAYDSVGIYTPERVPFYIMKSDANIVYTSTLNRAFNTAEKVFDDELELVSYDEFREFERRVFCFLNHLRLPLKFWTTTSRILWMLGINKKGIESFKEAKDRAKRAASSLENKAHENGKVILVAHGFLNRYLIKYLKKSGWNLHHDGGSDYLSTSILIKNKE